MAEPAPERGDKWPRELWLDAIWEDPDVKPNERTVAYAYARFAGGGATSWCSWDQLRRRTGIKSRDAIWRALSGLVDAGWLSMVDRPRQHRSAVYRLTVPLETPGVREADASEVRQPDCWKSQGSPAVREIVASSPGNRDQVSGKQDAINQIEKSEERSDLRRATARVADRGPHPFDEDPACPGVCRCGLPERNAAAHGRAAA
jgi:hypothetical protein